MSIRSALSLGSGQGIGASTSEWLPAGSTNARPGIAENAASHAARHCVLACSHFAGVILSYGSVKAIHWYPAVLAAATHSVTEPLPSENAVCAPINPTYWWRDASGGLSLPQSITPPSSPADTYFAPVMAIGFSPM